MERIEPVFSQKEQGTSGLYASRERAEVRAAKPQKLARPSLLEMEGRLSLANYWLYHATFNVDAFLLCYATAYVLLRHNPSALLLSMGVLFLFNCWIGLALVLRRTRDLGWSAGWCWLIALPLIGELFMLLIALKPGQRKSNRSGRPNPGYSRSEHHKIGLLAVLNTLMVVLLVVCFQTQVEDAASILTSALFELFSRR